GGGGWFSRRGNQTYGCRILAAVDGLEARTAQHLIERGALFELPRNRGGSSVADHVIAIQKLHLRLRGEVFEGIRQRLRCDIKPRRIRARPSRCCQEQPRCTG